MSWIVGLCIKKGQRLMARSTFLIKDPFALQLPRAYRSIYLPACLSSLPFLPALPALPVVLPALPACPACLPCCPACLSFCLPCLPALPACPAALPACLSACLSTHTHYTHNGRSLCRYLMQVPARMQRFDSALQI